MPASSFWRGEKPTWGNMKRKLSFFLACVVLAAQVGAKEWSKTVIGDDEIGVSLGRLEVELTKAPPDAQMKLLNDPERLRKVLGQMYLARILANEAVDRGLDKDPLLRLRVESYREGLLAKARLRQIRDEPVPDMTKAAQEYYRAHLDEFMSPERVDFSHILVQWKGKGRTREEAMELAGKLLAKVRQGEEISALADKYSDDPSVKKNHGHLGPHTRATLKPAFAKGIFALRKGESGLVESRFGVHVVKVLDKEPARQLSFEEVKEKIVARMEADIRKERVNAYLDRLKKRPLKLNKPVLDEYIREKKAELGWKGEKEDIQNKN